MNFLPIVGRELRVTARKRATWWTRLFAALGALVVFGWIWGMESRYANSAQIGRSVFVGLGWLAFVYAAVVGAFTTADCISEEKRDGTLGLLFLTNLKSRDILLGKLAATSLHAFYGLLAIFPVMAIPLLMGGTTAESVAKAALALVNTLFFSLSVGLAVSVVGVQERRVTGVTLGLLLGVVVLVPAAGALLGEWLLPKWITDGATVEMISHTVVAVSPGLAMGTAMFGPGGIALPDAFWWSTAFTQIMAWGCLLFAGARLRTAWQDKASSATAIRWRERWRQWCYGDGMERTRYRTRLLGINPWLWLTSRDRLKPWLVWLFLGVVVALWLWCWMELKRDAFVGWAAVLFCYPTHIALKLWMIGEATSRFGQDRQSGALELILATPIRVETMVEGQWRSLRRQFFWPTVLLLVVELLCIQAEHSDREWVMTVICYTLSSVVDFWAIGWVGMWRGLSSRKASAAARGTLARVLMLPWVIWLGWLLLAVWSRNRNSFESAMVFWFMLSVGVAFPFGLHARGQLLMRFREVATQRAEAR